MWVGRGVLKIVTCLRILLILNNISIVNFYRQGGTNDDFSAEYDFRGKVVDMQVSELHQYFDELSWPFIENTGSGSKTEQ